MTNKQIRFSYNDETVQISFDEPFFSRKISSENMAVYLLLGSALLEIQQFENQLSFLLSTLEIMQLRPKPPQTLDGAMAELRENNSRLTLGRLITRLSKHITDDALLGELRSIKAERNQLVHHFWRVLDWPFQDQVDVKREFELAEHLRVRMIYGHIALANYIQASDSRIKFQFAAIDLDTKKIIMDDGSEATRVKE